MTSSTTREGGLGKVFRPRSIAVAGASSDPTKTGGRPVHMLLKHGFEGTILPVNPKAGEIQGLPAYPSVDDLPEIPDLLVVAVPGAGALATLEAAARRGVGAAVVLSAGFAESGAEGAELQKRMTALAENTGMRIVGPNCLGSIGVRERAIGTFSIALEQAMPAEGGVSIVSQSGNIGSAALRMLSDTGAGVARFIATGNEADIQAGDAIEWLAGDSDTKVILCCLETCRDAGRLTRALAVARAAKKPVVVLKIGTSDVGRKAALSHTGGLAGSDRVYDAVFARYGAIRVRSLEGLVQVSAAIEALDGRRIGKSPSAAMIAASGGFGVMMADAASDHGVAVNPLTDATQARIREFLPMAATANPVDATAQMSANPQVMESLLEAVVGDDANTTLCVMLALGMEIPRLRDVFLQAFTSVTARHPDRALVACISGPGEAVSALRGLGVACFPTIDAAMSGIAALARLEAVRDETPMYETVAPAPLDADACRNEATAKRALAAAGIPFVEELVAVTEEEAAAATAKIGGPVAMKILSPDIQHKSDMGGVELGVAGADASATAFRRIMDAAADHMPTARIDGVLISPMTAGGTELILGTTTDPSFGPAIMVGLGGVFAEIFKDTALRLAPVTKAEAGEMLRELKAFPLLDGARGRVPADLDALTDIIAALSRFAARHADDVAEIDINPLLVRARGEGAVALDALIIPKSAANSETAA